ncbi:MAG: cytochrome c [Candidatus Tectomicrobia bacterium]|uniref:Cytochrome c n=1 Tax=Tectimicrobiota bacterium TaxID=2528274 RepID=A0A933LQQ9_UNCTE|nr:cytochrome c [Candidatus Tectomicrobia bacterium]
MKIKELLRKNLVLIVLFSLLINLMLVLQVLGAEQEDVSLPANPLEGRKVFTNKGCGKCHTVWGQGMTFGPDLAIISKGKSMLQLAGLLWNHSPRMVEIMEEKGLTRPNFTPKEMSLLMAYLYYLNYFDQPGDFTRGERVFKDKACINCHSLGGTGGKVGPQLDKYQRYMSSISFAQAMWNHGPKILKKMAEMGIKWPHFKGSEVNDFLAYIRGIGTSDETVEKVYLFSGNPKKGAKLFEGKGCLECHSVKGKGGKIGPDLAEVSAPGSASEMAGRMWNHGPEMWENMARRGIPLPELSAEEMADIISFVYFTFYMDKGGDPVKGKEYFAKKGCLSCHGLGKIGKRVGPDLSDSEAISSPVHLASAMWNHAPVMEKMFEEQNLPWPRFDGDEMRDLVEYIRSFGKGAKEAN